MDWLYILAQAAPPVDPITTIGSGWAGAGLLGLVLAWLLFMHLPAKDKQILALVQAKDIAVNEAIKQFRDESAMERASCKENFEMVSQAIDRLRNLK